MRAAGAWENSLEQDSVGPETMECILGLSRVPRRNRREAAHTGMLLELAGV